MFKSRPEGFRIEQRKIADIVDVDEGLGPGGLAEEGCDPLESWASWLGLMHTVCRSRRIRPLSPSVLQNPVELLVDFCNILLDFFDMNSNLIQTTGIFRHCIAEFFDVLIDLSNLIVNSFSEFCSYMFAVVANILYSIVDALRDKEPDYCNAGK